MENDEKFKEWNEMFENGIVPEFEGELTPEQKRRFINDTLEVVAKPLMYTFYMLKLQSFIEGDIVNDADGGKFKIIFIKV